jgi:hypothetical protein
MDLEKRALITVETPLEGDSIEACFDDEAIYQLSGAALQALIAALQVLEHRAARALASHDLRRERRPA